jgi:hypothetical protein
VTFTASGVFRPFVLTRVLNDGPTRRGQWVGGNWKSQRFVDALDPALLRQDHNQLSFCLPDEADAAVTLKEAHFVGELDTGTRLVESVRIGGATKTAAPKLLDPNNGDVRRVSSDEQILLTFERWISPDAVIIAPASDDWNVSCLDGSGTATPVDAEVVSIEGGRQSLVLTPAPERMCAALALAPSGSGAGVSYVDVVGSGTRGRVDWPRVVLSSAAEHFGEVAWVDGWMDAPAGAAGMRVEVQGQHAATTGNTFGLFLSRNAEPDSAWPIVVTARLDNGTPVTRAVTLNLSADARPRALSPRTEHARSRDDVVARYGQVGSAVQKQIGPQGGALWLGTHAGVRVPAGALTQPTNITVGHLGTEASTLDTTTQVGLTQGEHASAGNGAVAGDPRATTGRGDCIGRRATAGSREGIAASVEHSGARSGSHQRHRSGKPCV